MIIYIISNLLLQNAPESCLNLSKQIYDEVHLQDETKFVWSL